MGEINLTLDNGEIMTITTDKEIEIGVLKQRISNTKFSIKYHESKAKKAQAELQKLEKELSELEGENNG